jgi:crotonobetainyl-CoA:carnitine CoA-transferase CaiB-like acyl-CoA transferase
MTGVEPALGGYSVLDTGGAITAYCTKLLADLGADVLKVEPPQGDELRRRPPFVEDGSGGHESLLFSSYHANKRGITLDVRRAESRPVLEALGRRVDVVVASPTARTPLVGFDRSEPPSLDWATPDTIVACITPFGLTGPLRDLRVTPFLSFAMGGGMHWSGQLDGPPLALPGQGMWDEAGIYGALGVVAALFARDRSGGQILDLSVHEVSAAKDFLLERFDVGKLGEWGRKVGVGIPPNGVWLCVDGPFGIAAHQEHHWESFLAMLDHPDELSEPALADPLVRRQIFDGLQEVIAGLLAGRSRMDLFEKGQASGLPCAPLNTPLEFVGDAQPHARGTFQEVSSAGGTVTIPWRWTHVSPEMLSLRRSPPGLGEHNESVLVSELGFSLEQLKEWRAAGVV